MDFTKPEPRPKNVTVPVAVRLPPRYESPATESFMNGEVVAIPKLPEVTYTPPLPLPASEMPPFTFVAEIVLSSTVTLPAAIPFGIGSVERSEVTMLLPPVTFMVLLNRSWPVVFALSSMLPPLVVLTLRFWVGSAVTTMSVVASSSSTFWPLM